MINFIIQLQAIQCMRFIAINVKTCLDFHQMYQRIFIHALHCHKYLIVSQMLLETVCIAQHKKFRIIIMLI